MKRNLVPLLGIAFVVAVASTGVFYGLFVGKLNSSVDRRAAQIVVAAKALDRGVVIARDDLATVAWTAGALPKGAFQNTDQATGMKVLDPIAEGEPVLQAKLASSDPNAAGNGVPVGYRAISVHVFDSSGVVELLRPGQKVDVQVYQPKESGTEPEVRTVLQDLAVLSVREKGVPTGGGAQNLGLIPVVTLLAKPAEADILALSDSAARVRLLLRNPLDEGKARTAPVRMPQVLRGDSPRSQE
jgi:Flp pilus assembly protein CpaB